MSIVLINKIMAIPFLVFASTSSSGCKKIEALKNSETYSWTRTNPGGGGAFSSIGASKSGIIIAGSDLSGIYRSIDNGQSWNCAGAENGLTATHVSGIGFSTKDGNLLYVGTDNGLFRSSDGGETYKKVYDNGVFTDIKFGTDATHIGYASWHPVWNGLGAAVFKSQNNGLNWSKVSNNSFPLDRRILKIIVNKSDANIVYVLTGKSRFACSVADVFKSKDGGVNWSNITGELPDVYDMALDPNNQNSVFVTTINAGCENQWYSADLAGCLYKSMGGNSFTLLNNKHTGTILIDPDNSSMIRILDVRETYSWTVKPRGTFLSKDGGHTFDLSPTGNPLSWDTFFNYDSENNLFHSYESGADGLCKTIGDDLSNPNNIFWINMQWLFKSSNKGAYFSNIFTNEVRQGFWQSRGFDNVVPIAIDINKANPNIIYAAYFDIGLWRSIDKGLSWQSCNMPAYTGSWQGKGGNCHTVLSDPSRPNVVWASSSEDQHDYVESNSKTYLLKNINTGSKDQWILSNNGLPTNRLMGLSIDRSSPVNNRTLYITASGNVYKSANDGLNWEKITTGNNKFCFTAVDQFNGNIIYAGGANGLWVSKNGGGNWDQLGNASMKSLSDNEIYSNTYDGIFDIKTDPNEPNTVYVTILRKDATGGLYKGFYNPGTNIITWQQILADNYMRKVAICSSKKDYLLATSSSAYEQGGYNSNSHGVLISKDGGKNWVQKNAGMPWPFAIPIDVDNNSQPTVFAGSPGTGIQKSSDL